MIKALTDFGRMIKFSHTIFALPFALTAAVLAFTRFPFSWAKIGWIVAAMVGARSAAMGFNRIADAKWDARNPRTVKREIPRGAISVEAAGFFVVLSSALLVFASYQLNLLCFALSPVALGIVFFYSYTKRFTSFAHLFLGLSLGLAPVGSWMAIGGEFNESALMLGFAVVAWVAGFDIIYACQDVDFDRAEGLFSIPSRWGIARALIVSRFLHGLTVVLLSAVGVSLGLGLLYYTGLAVVAMVLFYEQSLVRADDFSRVNMAFFNMNGVVSLLFFAATTGDVLILGSPLT